MTTSSATQLEPRTAASDTPSDPSLTPEYAEIQALFEEAISSQREDPDNVQVERKRWETIATKTEPMLAKYRDLWLAIIATYADTFMDGIPGLASRLRLVHAMVVNEWEKVYPAAYPDESVPSLRINALTELNSNTFLRVLRGLVLFRADGHSPVTLRDLLVASAVIRVSEDQVKPDADALADQFSRFRGENLGAAEAVLDNAIQAAKLLSEVSTTIRGRYGSSVLQLDDLVQHLSAIPKLLGRGEVQPLKTSGGGDEPVKDIVAPGMIASRDQAKEMIDRIVDYLSRTEPSSPAPILLRQAKKMIGLGFMECLSEMGRLGLKDVKVLAEAEAAEASE